MEREAQSTVLQSKMTIFGAFFLQLLHGGRVFKNTLSTIHQLLTDG